MHAPSLLATREPSEPERDRHGLRPRDDRDQVIASPSPVIASEAKRSPTKITNAQAPYKIYNIGNNQPVTLRRFITAIETATGKQANENLLPMQAGDVPITYADVDDLIADTGFKPETSIEDGIAKFVDWYKGYYK